MYLKTRQVPAFPDYGAGANDNNGNVILAITGSTTAFACILALARMYVRAFMLKTFGADDWAMVVAMTCSGAVFALFVAEVRLGVGEHFMNPQLLGNLTDVLHYLWFHSWIIAIGISFVKISIGFFLLRLVQGKWYKRSIIAWIIFLFLFTLASMSTLIFQCLPIQAAWNVELRFQPTTKCFSTKTFRSIGLSNGAINLFTDFVFATLPISIIVALQINLRTKISLITVLSLGYFACAASIVKEILLGNFFKNMDPFFIELNAGIAAACLPALRPLFTLFLDTANTIKTNGFHRTILGHKYVDQKDTRMSHLPTRIIRDRANQGYGVIVGGSDGKTYVGRNIEFGQLSKLEQSFTETESGSEENALPRRQHRAYLPPAADQRERPRGILRTTEASVSR